MQLQLLDGIHIEVLVIRHTILQFSFAQRPTHISRRIFENTFTQSLYQIPVLSALHPLKVPDTAPERVRMQANADLLAEMRL